MPKPELVTKHKPQTNLLRAASFYSSINASNNPQTLLHLFSFFPNNFQKRNWRLYQDLNCDRRSRRWACWPLDNHHCPNVHNFGSIKNGLKLGTWCCLSCGQRPYLLLQQSKFEFHWRSTKFFLVILLKKWKWTKMMIVLVMAPRYFFYNDGWWRHWMQCHWFPIAKFQDFKGTLYAQIRDYYSGIIR